MRGGAIYILTNKHHTVLYVGVTSNLQTRVSEHINNKYDTSFTAKYNIYKLVYYELYPTIEDAISREKQIKKYRREKKNLLIHSLNPEWKDLYEAELKNW